VRQEMSDETQALCFLAGANSIFYGEKLLTTGNPDVERDRKLFERLGLKAERAHAVETTGAKHPHTVATTGAAHPRAPKSSDGGAEHTHETRSASA